MTPSGHPVHPPSRFRRRLLTHGLASVPLLVTAASVPVLAAVPQTASAYGSVLASAKPSQPVYVCNPFTLSAAMAELKAAMQAEANRLSQQSCGGLLGFLLCTVTSLLNSLLGLITGLFGGTTSSSQLQSQSPQLYTFMTNYRSAMWTVSPTTLFSTAIGNLGAYGNMTLVDVASASTSPLGQYFVCAFLNTSATGRIDATLLSTAKVRTIAASLNSTGYFQPTAGIQWNSNKVVEWWTQSLGLRL